MTNDYIENMADLCDYFYADVPARLNRRIYKDTQCGASISVYLAEPGLDHFGHYHEHPPVHNGDSAWDMLTRDTPIHSFTIQTIVEGSDATVDSEPFVLPVKTEEVEQWIDEMEREAAYLWDEANLESCELCGESLEDGEGYDGLCGNCADIEATRHED